MPHRPAVAHHHRPQPRRHRPSPEAAHPHAHRVRADRRRAPALARRVELPHASPPLVISGIDRRRVAIRVSGRRRGRRRDRIARAVTASECEHHGGEDGEQRRERRWPGVGCGNNGSTTSVPAGASQRTAARRQARDAGALRTIFTTTRVRRVRPGRARGTRGRRRRGRRRCRRAGRSGRAGPPVRATGRVAVGAGERPLGSRDGATRRSSSPAMGCAIRSDRDGSRSRRCCAATPWDESTRSQQHRGILPAISATRLIAITICCDVAMSRERTPVTERVTMSPILLAPMASSFQSRDETWAVWKSPCETNLRRHDPRFRARAPVLRVGDVSPSTARAAVGRVSQVRQSDTLRAPRARRAERRRPAARFDAQTCAASHEILLRATDYASLRSFAFSMGQAVELEAREVVEARRAESSTRASDGH